MTATTTDGAGLLAAILRDPADDTVRLAFADWLDEQGGEELSLRAWWIRHMVTTRATKAWDGDAIERSIKIIQGCPAGSRLARRILWGPYDLFGTTDQLWSFDRGFAAEVRCPLAAWQAHGPAVVRAHPVEVVRLTDRVPSAGGYYRGFQWWMPPDRRRRHEGGDVVPAELIDLMRADPRNTAKAEQRFVCLPTSDAALDALSAAAIAWAKSV